MEYRKICNVCGQVFCYDDKDISDNKANAALGVLSSVAAIANAVDGSMYHSYEQNKIGDKAVSKIKDFNRCPHCGSRDLRLLTEKEWQDYQDGLLGNNGGTSKSTVSINTNASVESLIKRGMLYLEDADWKTALAYFENALDADPTNSDAYIGKMMIDYRLKSSEELARFDQNVSDNGNYIKALRFAEGEKKNEIAKINETIKDNIEFNKQLEKYNEALAIFNTGGVENYDKARKLFLKLDSFKDSVEMAENCLNEKYAVAKTLIKSSHNSADVRKGINILKELSGYKDVEKLIPQAEEIESTYVVAEAKKAEEQKQAAVMAAKKRKRTFMIVAPILIALIAAITVYTTVIVPRQKYEKAVSFYKAGSYAEAYILFSELGDYSDSTIYLEKCYPYWWTESIKNVPVGSYITFGSYEQDNNNTNGKEAIEWLVLANDGDKMLVISRYGLDCKQYNTAKTSVTWEKCSIRSWLNSTFYNSAFSDVEKQLILLTNVSADKNPDYYYASQGNDTTDNVFLLSVVEATKYLSMEERITQGTTYANANGALKGSLTTPNNNCWWWLRTGGYNSDEAVPVDSTGGIALTGRDVTINIYTVRPALWINLEP